MIAHYIRRLYQKYVSWRKKRNWESQISSLPLFLSLPANPFDAKGRILIIAPHADDELIGCHQLIKTNYKNTLVFYCGLLGSNYSEENGHIRKREFEKYIESTNSKYRISCREHLIEDLRSVIKDFNPEYVFLPSFVDWQQEHREVNLAFGEASSEDAEFIIGWYHVSLPIPVECISAYSNLTKEQHFQKWDAMNTYYLSQLHMDIERFQFVEKFIRNDSYAAETYILMEKFNWINNIRKLRLFETDLNQLKDSLGNIYEMYTHTKEMYLRIQ